jgi:hypothetical protein
VLVIKRARHSTRNILHCQNTKAAKPTKSAKPLNPLKPLKPLSSLGAWDAGFVHRGISHIVEDQRGIPISSSVFAKDFPTTYGALGERFSQRATVRFGSKHISSWPVLCASS